MSNVYPASQQSYGISPTTGLMLPFTAVMDRDETRTNTAVLADSRDLIYPIGPSEVISWRMVLFFGGNSPGDIQIGFFTPAAPVSGGWIAYGTPPAAIPIIGNGGIAGYNGVGFVLEDSVLANDEFPFVIDGRLKNGVNGGYFRLQWAQNGANATPSILLTGSRLDVWKFVP